MDQAVHEGLGLSIVVAQQNGVAGLPLDQRGHIGIALRALEDHQITLPVTELAAIVDLGRPLVNTCFHRKNPVARGAGIAWFPLSAAFGQEAGQLR